MKTFKFFGVIILLLLYGCSMNEKFDSDFSDHQAAQKCKAVKENHSCEVITVNPSGNDDTQTLIDAFELAKTKGPGTTVKLVEGTYTIGMIAIHDFYGSFRGAGRTKTIITNKENLPCDVTWLNNELTALIKFINGDLVMSDMKIVIKDGKPCAFSEVNEEFYGPLFCALALGDWGATWEPPENPTPNMNAIIRNVDFIGGSNGEDYGVFFPTDHNTALAIWVSPDIWWAQPGDYFTWGKGKYLVDNCYFEYFLDGAEPSGQDPDATFEIKNSVFSKNYFQFYASSLNGSKVIVKNNCFSNAEVCDILVDDAWISTESYSPIHRTKFIIDGNVFNTPENASSLVLHDYNYALTHDDKYAMLYDVYNNVFKTSAGGIAIESINNKDAKIRYNWFKGTGNTGVQINGDEATATYAENNLVLDNNFKNADYDNAAVYLGPYSTLCKVVGVPTDKVIDEGVDNTIIGPHAQKHGYYHQWAADRMHRMNETMQKMDKFRHH
jgi:hypothetical protein